MASRILISLGALSSSLATSPQSALLALCPFFIFWMLVEWSWLSLSICAHLHLFAHNFIHTHGFNYLWLPDAPFPPIPPYIYVNRKKCEYIYLYFFLLTQHSGFNTTRLNYGSFAWSLFCPKSPSSLIMTVPCFQSFRSHVAPLVHLHSLTSSITCFKSVSSSFLWSQSLDLSPVLHPCLGPTLQYIPKRIAIVIPFKYLIHGWRCS